MALLALITGQGPKLRIAEFDVEVCLSEEATREAQVTQNPVEDGVDISDHVQVMPDTLVIRGMVSNTPVRFLSGARSLLDLSNFNGDGNFEGETRAFQSWSLLTDIHTEREPVEIQTGFEFYENMILTTLQRSRDKDTGNALFFTATFKEIVTVSSEFITLPKGFGAKKEIGKTEKKSQSGAGNGSILSNVTGLK